MESQEKFQVPNYTPIPNTLLGDHLKRMRHEELRVVLALCYYEFGWHTDKTPMTVSMLSTVTGLSESDTVCGLSEAIENRLVSIVRHEEGYEHIVLLIATDEEGEHGL